MRPVLIDTNAYAAFKRNDQDILEVIRHAVSIAISPIVGGELIVCFNSGNKAKRNKSELQEFMNSPRVILYPITLDTSHCFSHVFNVLKSKGKPIPTNDMWIAAQAMEHGCVVCTHQKHFASIDGLIAGSTTSDLFLLDDCEVQRDNWCLRC